MQRLDPASQAALDAALSGQDPNQASKAANDELGFRDVSPHDPEGSLVDNTAVDADQERIEQLRGRQEEEESDQEEEVSAQPEEESAQSEQSEEEEEGSEADPDVETVFVKGPNGRRQRLEIDYTDRDKIKKAYMGLAGMRKAYKERDEAIAELKNYSEGDNKDKIETWDALEEAWESGGIEAVVNTLLNDENGFEAAVAEWQDKRQQWESMSDAERLAYEKEREVKQRDSKYETLAKQFEEFKKSVTEEREQAEVKGLETTVSSAFEQYNFDGILGNPTQETMLNKMLWSAGREALAEFPDDVPLTANLARRVFRQQAKLLKDMIKTEGTKQAEKTIEKKKKKAASTVRKVKGRAQAGAATDDDFNKALKSGDIKGLAKAWWKAQSR